MEQAAEEVNSPGMTTSGGVSQGQGFGGAGRLARAPVRVEVRGRDCSSWEPRVQDGIHSIQFPLQA